MTDTHEAVRPLKVWVWAVLISDAVLMTIGAIVWTEWLAIPALLQALLGGIYLGFWIEEAYR